MDPATPAGVEATRCIPPGCRIFFVPFPVVAPPAQPPATFLQPSGLPPPPYREGLFSVSAFPREIVPRQKYLSVRSISFCFNAVYGGYISWMALKRVGWASTPRMLEKASKPKKPWLLPKPLWPTPPNGRLFW
jgi:hypothetical protein